MTKRIEAVLITLLVALTSGAVWAGEYADGMVAYQKKEYVTAFKKFKLAAAQGDADGNKDGRITSGELQQYLSEMVGKQAMGLNRTQNTQILGDANKVLVGR